MSIENEQSAPVTTAAPIVSDGGGSSSAPSIRSEIEASRNAILGKERGSTDHAPPPAQEPKPDAQTTPDAAKPESKTAKTPERNIRGVLGAIKNKIMGDKAKLKADAEALQKKQGEAPKAEDYKDERELQSAQIQHNIEVSQAQKALEAKAQELQQSEQKEWTDRCQNLTSDFGKFSESYNKHHGWLTENQPEMMEFAQQSTVGPIILENAFNKLFADSDEYERWMSLTPAGRRHELVLAEHAITQAMHSPRKSETTTAQTSNPSPAVPAVSKAPVPIKPEGGSGIPGSSGTSLRAQIEQSKRRQMG